MIVVRGDQYDYVFDVRTESEFLSGHLPGSVNFNVHDMINGQMPGVSKSAKVGLYCRSGSRSGLAAEILKSNGFKDVNNLGGLKDLM